MKTLRSTALTPHRALGPAVSCMETCSPGTGKFSENPRDTWKTGVEQVSFRSGCQPAVLKQGAHAEVEALLRVEVEAVGDHGLAGQDGVSHHLETGGHVCRHRQLKGGGSLNHCDRRRTVSHRRRLRDTALLTRQHKLPTSFLSDFNLFSPVTEDVSPGEDLRSKTEMLRCRNRH